MVWSVLEWRVETGPELPRSPASAWSLVGFPSPSCLASAPPRAALVSPTTARGHHRQVPCPFPPLCLLRLTTLMPRLMRKEDQRKHAPICTVGAFARKMQPVPLTSFLLWSAKPACCGCQSVYYKITVFKRRNVADPPTSRWKRIY